MGLVGRVECARICVCARPFRSTNCCLLFWWAVASVIYVCVHQFKSSRETRTSAFKSERAWAHSGANIPVRKCSAYVRRAVSVRKCELTVSRRRRAEACTGAPAMFSNKSAQIQYNVLYNRILSYVLVLPNFFRSNFPADYFCKLYDVTCVWV